MRKPSENLKRQLAELNLCAPNQLRACEKQVDRLSDGLPDFDSVWLDVLVQRQVISRFQADKLQQGNSADLQLGKLILREQLGDRSFLAITPTEQPLVLQQRELSSESERKSLSSLIEALNSERQSAPASLAVPIRLAAHEVDVSDHHVFVASRFQPGWTVAELIVRGGRLPWQNVLFIAQQASLALAWLHARGCCHGNLNSSNVRVSPEGHVVLVGVLGSRFAEGGISISANLNYDEARFCAPERTLNLQPANFQSDLYSLGAVLWNLLAARDAFLTTDPISRITKAGQENLPDIRTLVPDCPAEFALAIQRFSKSNPQLRPENPAQALELIKAVGGGSRQGLRGLVKTLPDRFTNRFPARRPASLTNRMVTTAVASLMVLAFVGYGIQRGLIPSVASLTTPDPNAINENRTSYNTLNDAAERERTQLETASDRNQILTLPQPDVAGVVVLKSGRKYHASELKFPGVMHVETSGSESAQIIVGLRQTWNLSAQQLNLSNVHVVHRPTERTAVAPPASSGRPTDPPAILATAVHARADAVSIRKCVIESSLADQKAVCLHWSIASGTTATLQIEDCVLKSNGAALSTSGVPQRCDLRNCLMLVKRSVLRATLPASMSAPWPLTIHRITQPFGLTFADFLMPEADGSPCRVIMTAGESVLSPTLALVQFASVVDRAATESRIEFRLPDRGNAVIVPPQVTSAVAWDQSLRSVVALAPDNVVSDSILSAEPLFRGVDPEGMVEGRSQWRAFELIDYDGPKLTSELPGVRISNLPQLSSGVKTPSQLASPSTSQSIE